MSTVAEFSIEYHQCLDEHSEIVGTLPAFAKDPAVLVDLYRTMLLTRIFDNKGIALQRTGKMGTFAPNIGQEAIGAAIGYALKKEDVLAPYYRDYAAQLSRGVTMAELYTYWGGDERGNCYEHNAHDFPISVPIASQCLHAAGAATAFKLRKEPRVALATCGEGGTSEGDFYESINVAGIWNLPAVFVINNNQWAISVARDQQTRCQTIAQKAIAAGIDGCQVDGNDVIALCDHISQAVEKARRGEGATVIEAITYRLGDHTTADDASRYRSQEELDTAWKKEPIERLRRYLTNIGAWDDEKQTTLETECTQAVADAVETYLHRSPSPVTNMFDYHYDTLPADLAAQREYALENEA